MKQEEKKGNTDIGIKREKEEIERKLEEGEEGRKRDQKILGTVLSQWLISRRMHYWQVPCRDEGT